MSGHKPTTIKSYIDGDHISLCENCGHIYRCGSYDRKKKVFYCSTKSPKPVYQRKRHNIITQSVEEQLCEANSIKGDS